MDIHRNLKDFIPLSSSVVTIGSYDGLHRGHFQIVNRVQSIAQSIGTTSIVITFEPHPRCVIDKDHNKALELAGGKDKGPQVIAGDPASVIYQLEELEELGFDLVITTFPRFQDLEDMKMFADEIMPHFC